MNKVLIALIAIVILGGGGYYLYNSSQKSTNPAAQMMKEENTESNAESTSESMSGSTGSSMASSGVMNGASSDTSGASGAMMNESGASGADAMTAKKTFKLEGGMYYFKPNVIKVKKGDTVEVTLTSVEGMHDFVIDEFNAKTTRVTTGQSATVTFVADKVGTFEFYCSVDSHRQKGMVGTLTVTE